MVIHGTRCAAATVDPANLDTDVLLGRRRPSRLTDLLPEHEGPEPLG